MSDPIFVPAPVRPADPAYRVMPAATSERPPLESVTRIVTALWLALSGINFTVWLLVSIISGSVDSPWFLWAFAAGAAVVGGLKLANRYRWSG